MGEGLAAGRPAGTCMAVAAPRAWGRLCRGRRLASRRMPPASVLHVLALGAAVFLAAGFLVTVFFTCTHGRGGKGEVVRLLCEGRVGWGEEGGGSERRKGTRQGVVEVGWMPERQAGGGRGEGEEVVGREGRRCCPAGV